MTDTIEDVRLAPFDGGLEPAWSRLFVAGEPLGSVAGVVLEGAFRIAGRFLLVVTSADRPFEETVTFSLLDADGTHIDRRELGWAYTAGVVAGLASAPPHGIFLRFPSEATWHVLVRPGRWWSRRPARLELRRASRLDR